MLFIFILLKFIVKFSVMGSLKIGTRANFRWDFEQLQGSETQCNTTEYIPNVFQVSLTKKMRKVVENLP